MTDPIDHGDPGFCQVCGQAIRPGANKGRFVHYDSALELAHQAEPNEATRSWYSENAPEYLASRREAKLPSTEIAALVSELADGLIYDWDKNSGETDVHDEDGIVITFENEIDEDGWAGVRFHVAVDGNYIAHGNVDTDPDSVTVEFDD